MILRSGFKHSHDNVSRTIPGIEPILDVGAFSDTSLAVGIGIIIGDRWRTWTLTPGWNQEGCDIGWAEALGFELLISILLSLSPDSPSAHHLRVYRDNQGVVDAWASGHSCNWQTNLVFRRIHHLLEPHEVFVHPRYIPSKDNPTDGPSRGIYPPQRLLLPPILIPDKARPFLVDIIPLCPCAGSRLSAHSDTCPSHCC